MDAGGCGSWITRYRPPVWKGARELPGGSAVTERRRPQPTGAGQGSPASSAVGSGNWQGSPLPPRHPRSVRLPELSQALGLCRPPTPVRSGVPSRRGPPPGRRLGPRQGRQRDRRAGRAPSKCPVFSAQHLGCGSGVHTRQAAPDLRFPFQCCLSIMVEYKTGTVISISTRA